MKTLSISAAKIKLNSLVEAVHATNEEIMITTNGTPVAYIVSPDEFEGWKETVAIKSDEAFLKEINAGIRNIRNGKAKLYTLEKLFK
jgi:antitoxin YefM